jgi:hypothetical protein
MVKVWWEAALPIVLRRSKNYYVECITEPRRLPKDVAAAWGAVILRFPEVNNLYQ